MFFRFLLCRLAMWSALLVVGLGIWLGVLASSAGLTSGWKDAVRKEFARQGIPISIGKLTLDPIHGLVARDVRVYEESEESVASGREDAQPGTRVLADISRIDLDVSLARLLQGQVYLNSLHVRDAQTSLPIDPDQPDGERMEVSGFHARVLLSEDSIEIQELRGRVFGLLISMNGELVRQPRADRKKKDKPEARSGWRGLAADQRESVRRLIRTLAMLETPKGAPAELRVRAMADMGRMEEGRFEFSFRAPAITWDRLRVEDVTMRGHYDNGLLQAEDVRFHDRAGSFRAEADFVRASRTLRFNLESHAALPERLLQKYWPDSWPRVEFISPPTITAGGNLVFTKDQPIPAGLVTGAVAIGQTRAQNTTIEYASANLAWDGRRLFLRDMNLRVGPGVLEADLLLDGTVMQAVGQSSIHPEAVAPILPAGYVKRLLSSFDCSKDSVTGLGFTVRGDFADRFSWAVDTRIEAANLRFHGVPVTSATGKWSMLPGGGHVFRDAAVSIPAGATTGVGDGKLTTQVTTAGAREITLSPPTGPTGFRGLRCQGWPHTVVAAIVPEVMGALPKFALSAPADIAVDGTLGGKTGPRSDLVVTGRSAGTVLYPAFGKLLPLEQPVARVLVKDRAVLLPEVKAFCYGGNVAGSLRFDNPASPKGSSSGRLVLEKVGYQDLMRLFSDRVDEEKGTLDLNFTFQTREGTLATMDADGSMRLTNGDLFSIPLFGPLSPLIEAVLPQRGIGYSVASTATASCTVRQGLLTTEDFNALTPAFKMDGHGTINLPDGAVEFNARFNARGIAEIATVLFSYIFEYKCEGTLAEPQWRPLHIPKIPLPKILLPGRKKDPAPARR